MQTIGRTKVRTSGENDNLSHQTGNTLRDGKREEGYGAKRCRNSFLRTPIIPIAPTSVTREDRHGNRCNLITQENYIYLRDSYFRYAELMDIVAEHTPGRSIGESISNLYDEMNSLISGDGTFLNFEENDGRLYFNLWRTHMWGDFTLYYFPVKFIEKLNPKLRRIAVTFMHDLMKGNGFTTINDEDDTDYIIEWISEGYHENDEDRKTRKKLLDSYKNGRAYKLLERVWRKSYYKNLPKAIERYVCRNDFEHGLVNLMKDGLEFLNPQKPITLYSYDPFFDDEPEYLPMELGQQIRVVYDCEDLLTEHLIDFFNSNRQETYEIIPVSTFEVTPDIDDVFRMEDTYPERFFRWADRFIHYTR